MDELLEDAVRQRAGDACEYCRMPQAFYPTVSFPIDHIIARQHGGPTVLSNLALSCLAWRGHWGGQVSNLPDDGFDVLMKPGLPPVPPPRRTMSSTPDRLSQEPPDPPARPRKPRFRLPAEREDDEPPPTSTLDPDRDLPGSLYMVPNHLWEIDAPTSTDHPAACGH